MAAECDRQAAALRSWVAFQFHGRSSYSRDWDRSAVQARTPANHACGWTSLSLAHDQAEHERRPLAATVGAGEQPCLAAESDAAQVGDLVGRRDSRQDGEHGTSLPRNARELLDFRTQSRPTRHFAALIQRRWAARFSAGGASQCLRANSPSARPKSRQRRPPESAR